MLVVLLYCVAIRPNLEYSLLSAVFVQRGAFNCMDLPCACRLASKSGTQILRHLHTATSSVALSMTCNLMQVSVA